MALPELLRRYAADVEPITDTLDQKGRVVSEKAKAFRAALESLLAECRPNPSLGPLRAEVDRAATDSELAVKELELLARKFEVNIDAFMDEVFLKHLHTGRQDAPFVARHRLPDGGWQPQGDEPALFVDNMDLDPGAEPAHPRHTANIRRMHVFTKPD